MDVLFYFIGEIIKCDIKVGLECIDADNFSMLCIDYKIRYFCDICCKFLFLWFIFVIIDKLDFDFFCSIVLIWLIDIYIGILRNIFWKVKFWFYNKYKKKSKNVKGFGCRYY